MIPDWADEAASPLLINFLASFAEPGQTATNALARGNDAIAAALREAEQRGIGSCRDSDAWQQVAVERFLCLYQDGHVQSGDCKIILDRLLATAEARGAAAQRERDTVWLLKHGWTRAVDLIRLQT